MLETYGHWYIYFTYGMHWCANVTTNKGAAGAVLIRAVEPLEGLAAMRRRRSKTGARELCSGPAKFCEAFDIKGKDNRAPLSGNFGIYDAPEIARERIGVSGRIGIKSGVELPWRFYIKGNAFVSRTHPSRRARGRGKVPGGTKTIIGDRDVQSGTLLQSKRFDRLAVRAARRGTTFPRQRHRPARAALPDPLRGA